MELTRSTLRDTQGWAIANVSLPGYDIEDMVLHTEAEPVWAHFGAGNIFRGYIANIQHKLLEMGLQSRGITAISGHDTLEAVYRPHDNLVLLCALKADGTTQNSIIGSIAEALTFDERGALRQVFESDALQMVSFTITEKGYQIRGLDSEYLPIVAQDMRAGPDGAQSVMAIVCTCLHWRYLAGEAPIALISMDNCKSNGEKLRASVVEIGRAWDEQGLIAPGFLAYLEDEAKVSFPWSMIDKITPRPAESVRAMLLASGIMGMQISVTSKNTFIAPFVNAEIPEYLVIEDRFPNGRPPLEQAGVLMTDRQTVRDCERMKVTACLNPLHTALAVFGCLLGYTLIADEMQDPELGALARRIGYEGMRVVVDPKIIDPERFLEQVLTERLPNPFMPDAPQRIATDTSQKVGIRFGETIKSYIERPELDVRTLQAIPLALAGWLRYLLGVDDDLRPFEVSSDPMLEALQAQLQGIVVGKPDTLTDQLSGILSNERLFGVNLYEAGLADAVEANFKELIQGPGAVRVALKRHLQ